MTDDTAKRGPQDAARVNVHDDHEVSYWCDRFGVTKRELQDAVIAVGPMAKDVEAKLKAK